MAWVDELPRDLRPVDEAGDLAGCLPDGRPVVARAVPAATADERQRLLAHARRLSDVSDPRLVPVLGAVADGQTVWVLTEGDAGRSLDELLDADQVTPRQAVAIGLAVLGGLVALQRAGLAHGSLHHGSVRIAADGRVRLDGCALQAPPPDEDGLRFDQAEDLVAAGVVLCAALGVPTRPAPGELSEAERIAPALVATARSLAGGRGGWNAAAVLASVKRAAGRLAPPDGAPTIGPIAATAPAATRPPPTPAAPWPEAPPPPPERAVPAPVYPPPGAGPWVQPPPVPPQPAQPPPAPPAWSEPAATAGTGWPEPAPEPPPSWQQPADEPPPYQQAPRAQQPRSPGWADPPRRRPGAAPLAGRRELIWAVALLLAGCFALGLGLVLARASSGQTGSRPPSAGASASAAAPGATATTGPQAAATPGPGAATAAAEPPAPTPGTGAQAATTPDGAVSRFYALIAQHDFADAVALWSPRMRADYPPDVNVDQRFATTTSMQVLEDRVSAASGGSASVSVRLVEVRSGRTYRWEGTWHLVRTGSGWLLDQPALGPG